MDYDILNLQDGDYTVIQIDMNREIPCIYWDKIDASFIGSVKKSLSLYSLKPKINNQRISLVGDDYTISGMGYCRIKTGNSSKSSMFHCLFGGGCDTYGLTVNYNHLKRWAEWLLKHNRCTTYEIGPPLNSVFGPWTSPNVVVQLKKQFKDINGTKRRAH